MLPLPLPIPSRYYLLFNVYQYKIVTVTRMVSVVCANYTQMPVSRQCRLASNGVSKCYNQSRMAEQQLELEEYGNNIKTGGKEGLTEPKLSLPIGDHDQVISIRVTCDMTETVCAPVPRKLIVLAEQVFFSNFLNSQLLCIL